MSYSDVECPYCGKGDEICHDDGYGYEEDQLHQQECGECGKIFIYETSISFSYEAAKADCLNGAEHQYKETNTYPRCFRRLRCVDCGEEKEIEGIEEERHKYMDSLPPVR